ncbi:glycoside hydrolase family 2 TIM barrel-domain containing protein [Fulvivirgaceae bacterium BMA12]|uniref:Glycoside hydrolase family 2 TIM barrel-domain containing protein n=1 Tax=Agaribacillus aureus TaxID=3051825 RepID=A0ABT8LJE6_9BACT|nr:glycoside hydrolase family 2 TIM barrel-domain containing protein [Fulvivirgaceae bacterium BMA12]
MSDLKRSIVLDKDWRLYPSARVTHEGKQISNPSFDASSWHTANVPSTVLAALVENGIYKDLYFGTNLKDVDTDQFNASWWYRKHFELPALTGETVLIDFSGINYRANIWLNGHLLAPADEVLGAFRTSTFDITRLLQAGSNVLAVEVFPPQPGDFSIGFVDWNQRPPDNNMGIFRPVKVKIVDGVSIANAFVESEIDFGLVTEASLRITAQLFNHTDKPITGQVKCLLGDIQVTKMITLSAYEHRDITLDADNHPALKITKPKLWWPNNLGEPHLYTLNCRFEYEDKCSDATTLQFGIRIVADYFTEDGHRGFMVNGKKILIKGAGWTDDLLLQDTHESLATQIKYVKHMNLNCIRLEGFWGKDQALYDLCDQHGILVMVGWSCHWEHEQYLGKPVHTQYGGVTDEDDITLIAESWKDQLLMLRHHPCIFVWTVASDFLPHPELEKKYIALFKQYDNSRPYLNSTGGVGSEKAIITDAELISEISGSSGVKMLGPYAYTPPVYWYTDKSLGGAYGFNTETCPGANIPPMASIRKMIPGGNLWPIDETWEYHCGLNDFSKLDRIEKAISERYGKPAGVEAFAKKAQVLNYELMRPMFEAFRVNKAKTTGIIQWMLNSALPNMYWQLYDSYLLPNGAFYGTKKACQPIQIIYDYGSNSVVTVNDTYQAVKNLTAKIRIFDLHANELFTDTCSCDLDANGASPLLTLPATEIPTTAYFLDLKLLDALGTERSGNFYWLSTKHDELDYEAKFDDWAYYTPSKTYADFKALNTLRQVEVLVEPDLTVTSEEISVSVLLINPSKDIAFFNELSLLDAANNETVVPVFWDDNYVSILPETSIRVKALVPNTGNLHTSLRLQIEGYNVSKQVMDLALLKTQ